MDSAGKRAAPREPRVLFVSGALFGGAGRVTVELALELRRRGLPTAVFLALGAGDLLPEARERGLPVFASEEGTTAGALKALGLFVRAFVRLLWRARRYDVLIAANDAVDHLLAVSVGRLLGKRAIGVFQLTPSNHLAGLTGFKRTLMSWAMRWGTPHLDLLVAVSDGVRDDAATMGIVPPRTVVIPNGIPLERVRALAQAAVVPPGELPRVLGVGRLAPEKGFDVLIRAHALARAQTPHRLRLVGAGDERARLERLIAELGLGESVELVGHRDNPYPELLAADLICVPSRHEGSPLIVREALLLERPLIASDATPGLRQALGDGAYGRLVPSEDVEALAGAIVDHIRRPADLVARAAAGQLAVEEQSLEAMADRYLAVLTSPTPPERPRSDPRVAVVIPCYDDGATLSEALGSLEVQEPVELVIVDDGSTDQETLDLFSRLEAQGVRILHQANAGPAAARMAGVAVTRAPYVFVLDADDLLPAQSLTPLADRLDEEPSLELVWGDIEFFGDYADPKRSVESFDPWLLTYMNEVPGAGSLVRREVLERSGGWTLRSGWEDWDLWQTLAEQGARGARVPGFCLRYRQHGIRRARDDNQRRLELLAELRRRHPRLYACRCRLWWRSSSPLSLRLMLPAIDHLPLAETTRMRLGWAASDLAHGRPLLTKAWRRLRRELDRSGEERR